MKSVYLLLVEKRISDLPRYLVLIRLVLVEAPLDKSYQVLEAASALEAVAVLGGTTAMDAVVTDVDMPGDVSGIDLA